MGLEAMSAVKLSQTIRTGKITVKEAVMSCLEAIHEKEMLCHSYITIYEKEALAQAEKIQRELEQGKYENSPLAGIPIAVKDNICMKGGHTTCGSQMLANFVSPYDAEVITRLKAAGMIILGKTNLDEFAMGSTTETSWFGATRHPYHKDYVPGGSSGGSAAAVAAGEAMLALGSDTGGSIRQPCAFCGVTGLKPTYGRVSRYGLIAYASSLDQIGPIGRTAEECAALLQIISGPDPKDATCSKETPPEYLKTLKESVRGKKIGIPVEYFGKELSEEGKKAVLAAAQDLKQCGAVLKEIHLTLVDYALPAYYILAFAEASSNLARYDGVKYGFRASAAEGLDELYQTTRSLGFGNEVKRRLLIGSFVLSSGYYEAYYLKALKIKALIQEEFNRAFDCVDLILTPVTPTSAPKLGESLSDPLKMYFNDSYTVPVSLAGLPAGSVPCGTDANGIPIGVQIIGKPLKEQEILQAAYQYEQVRKISETVFCKEKGSEKSERL